MHHAHTVGLGRVAVGVTAFGNVLRQRGTWAATMVAIASFYVVFAIQSGDPFEIVVHTGLAIGFALLAIIGARVSAWLIAAALLVHGVYDISVGAVLSNPAPGWWGPFCLAIDVVLAVALGVMLWRGQKLE